MSGQGDIVHVQERDGGGHVVQATTTGHRLATVVLAEGVLGTPAADEILARVSDLEGHAVASPKAKGRARDGRA